jgi:hypothetical protein
LAEVGRRERLALLRRHSRHADRHEAELDQEHRRRGFGSGVGHQQHGAAQHVHPEAHPQPPEERPQVGERQRLSPPEHGQVECRAGATSSARPMVWSVSIVG